MSQRARVWPVALSLVCVVTAHATSQEIRPGVWAAQEPQTLPLPVGGYSAYLVGELHGIQENAAFQLRYLMQLRAASGVRDVAIEEDAAYEEDAAAFVNGDSKVLPEPLCVHADIFDSIRRLNAGLEPDARIRVHLTDIDSPASAIRRHLADLQQRLRADRVRIPDVTEIKRLGLEAVAQLSQLPMDAATRAGLRTVAFSIQAYQQGLEIGLGAPHGSPYLDAREEAVADNILDLVRGVNSRPLLVLYGSDHVSRAAR